MSNQETIFSRVHSFADCAGNFRDFKFTEVLVNEGYCIDAEEIVEAGVGYKFSAWSSFRDDCLAILSRKIRRELSRKYLLESPSGSISLSHDELWGLISPDGIVIDGRLIGWEAFMEMLKGRGGFQLKMSISEETA